MLDLLEVQNSSGALLSLPLEDTSGGFVVQSIDGLDPVKATLVSSTFGALDGGIYQSARRETRNIIITLGLDPDYISTSTSDLRKQLHNFFMPKSPVTLTFYKDDGSIFTTNGRVESFTQPLFAQDPEIQISIICYDPDFLSTNSIIVNGNSDSTENSELVIPYSGTVETGMLFTFTLTNPITSFTFTNLAGDGNTYSLSFTYESNSGDVVVINTVPGQRECRIISGDSNVSGLWAIDSFSDWIKLYPGDNHLEVVCDAGMMPFTVEYTERFGGI